MSPERPLALTHLLFYQSVCFVLITDMSFTSSLPVNQMSSLQLAPCPQHVVLLYRSFSVILECRGSAHSLFVHRAMLQVGIDRRDVGRGDGQHFWRCCGTTTAGQMHLYAFHLFHCACCL
jgi:hypothetical protein